MPAETTDKAAAKAAEKEAAKLAKAAEKEAKKAEREAAKQAEKDAKVAERDAKKQAALASKEAKKAEREAVKQDRLAQKAARVAEREASRRPKQNGVREPNPQSICGTVWGVCNTISSKTGEPAKAAEVMEACKSKNIDDATTRTQFARWKKFHGLTAAR